MAAEKSAFDRWRGRGSEPGLRGIVLYDALMHTGDGFKVLERNSRGGNTEQISVLATIENDFVDICFKMLEGSLKSIRFSKKASVVMCAVPRGYGIPQTLQVEKERIDLTAAFALQGSSDGLGVYPMDVRVEGGSTYLGGSRSVAVVGTRPTIEEARALSLAGVDALRGPLRTRRDIAGARDLRRSAEHMESLRRHHGA